MNVANSYAVKYFCGNPEYNEQSSKEQHLFETENFCNIINAFTVTFDQLNVSLLNKSIN